MKIQYISDLHLEFPEHRSFYKEHRLKPLGDVLCIAGDLGYLNFRRRRHVYEKHCDAFLDYCSDNWKTTIIVPGNHEFYNGYKLKELPSKVDISDNVFLLNNAAHIISDVKFLGCTFWSSINPTEHMAVARNMNDYNFILYNKIRKFSPILSTAENKFSIDFFKTEFAKKDTTKTVIVTHHAPHKSSLNDYYNSHSFINSAYFTDMTDFILEHKPLLWVHGHTHAYKDYTIGETNIVSNSIGYLDYTNEPSDSISLNWASMLKEI
jgi:Icc-related predicted phosphoesterase